MFDSSRSMPVHKCSNFLAPQEGPILDGWQWGSPRGLGSWSNIARSPGALSSDGSCTFAKPIREDRRDIWSLRLCRGALGIAATSFQTLRHDSGIWICKAQTAPCRNSKCHSKFAECFQKGPLEGCALWAKTVQIRNTAGRGLSTCNASSPGLSPWWKSWFLEKWARGPVGPRPPCHSWSLQIAPWGIVTKIHPGVRTFATTPA